MAVVYDARLGRLRFITVFDDLKETLGDGVEAVGAAVVAAERKGRPFSLSLPVRGHHQETDPVATGERLRRQVRALLENGQARLQGLYFRFDADPALNGWLIVGGGDLEYEEGRGPTFGDYKLTLTDCYRIAGPRTHRPARRLRSWDRRLSTTYRDQRGTQYSTAFAAQTALVRHWLPAGASDLVTDRGVPVAAATQAGIFGNELYLDARPDGETIDYEHAEADHGKGDVVIKNRRPGGARNFVTDPSFERDTAGWSGEGYDNAGAYVAQAALAAYGRSNDWAAGVAVPATGVGGAHFSLFLRIASGQRLAAATDSIGVSPGEVLSAAIAAYASGPAGATVRAAVEFFGPASYLGGDYTGADLALGTSGRAVNEGIVVPAGATSARLYVQQTGGAASERFMWIDEGMLVRGPTVGGYFDGDSDGADWEGTAHASVSVQGWEEVYGPDQELTAGDVPVIENGRCRVRWVAAQQAFAVEHSTGGPLAEIGRVTAWDHSAGVRYTTLLDANVVEWTPERAVLRVVLAAAGSKRAEVYITLQRGWPGPRLEVYGRDGTSIPQVKLRISANLEGAATLGKSSGTAAVTDGANTGNFAAIEPWLYLLPTNPGLPIHAAVLDTAVATLGRDDTTAYGSTRKAVELGPPTTGYSGLGYVSAHLGAGARGSETADAQTLGRTGLIDAEPAPDVVTRT